MLGVSTELWLSPSSQQMKKGLDRFIKGGDFQWAEKAIFCDAYWGNETIKKDEYYNGISYWKVNMD